MSRRLAIRMFMLFILFTVGACWVYADQIVDFSHIPEIDNGPSPEGGTIRIELEELWRAGGDDDDYFFGAIGDCLLDENGNFYFLDRQLCEVSVYSPTGERLRTLSGQGEGPGEITDPMDIFFYPGGDVGITHRAAGEVTRLSRDGTPQTSYHLSSSKGEPLAHVRIRQVNVSGENFVLCAHQRRRTDTLNDTERFLSIFSPTGVEGIKLINNTKQGFNFEELSYHEGNTYFVDRSGWTTDARGRIYIAPERNRYLIHVFNPDGTALRAITREFTPPLRTEAEKQKITDGQTLDINGGQIQLNTEIEEREAAIVKLRIDRDGLLWVKHSHSKRDQTGGAFLTYDRFSPEGRFIDQVEIICQGDPKQDQLHCLSNDYFIMLRGIVGAFDSFTANFNSDSEEDQPDELDEPRPLEVICYRRK
jgi:hypothetical protein